MENLTEHTLKIFYSFQGTLSQRLEEASAFLKTVDNYAERTKAWYALTNAFTNEATKNPDWYKEQPQPKEEETPQAEEEQPVEEPQPQPQGEQPQEMPQNTPRVEPQAHETDEVDNNPTPIKTMPPTLSLHQVEGEIKKAIKGIDRFNKNAILSAASFTLSSLYESKRCSFDTKSTIMDRIGRWYKKRQACLFNSA